MKKIIIALFLIGVCIPSFAEKTEDMYIMRHTTKGQLFFITEKIFPSKDRTFNLPFDITYMNSTDSVSIKMTVTGNTLTNVDSVALLTDNNRFICPVVKSIYKEKEKKHWTHRCDCKFSYEATKKCFVNVSSPKIIVYTAHGEHSYEMPEKKWQILRKHLVEIFMLIDASKK